MSDISASQQPVSFSQNTRASFAQHLREHPSNRRVSPIEKENIIEWLTNPEKRPSSQREFSRRNYARKTFVWDNERQDLLAINKSQEGGRIVVAEDRIADTVEFVHNRNGHAGWDATWKDVSTSYHGILRSDVIYLLRRCQVCLYNPLKRPKNPHRAVEDLILEDSEGLDLLCPDELEEATMSPNKASNHQMREADFDGFSRFLTNH
ncbi:hypothetical protein BDV18DRAFT_146786 [Aspergillus unguis]